MRAIAFKLAAALGIVCGLTAQTHAATLAYVPNREAGTISVIDPHDASVVDILPYAGKPAGSIHGLVYNRSGGALHLFDAIGNLIGTVRMQRGSPYPDDGEPKNVSLAPDSRHLAICDMGESEVVFVDTATLFEAWSIPRKGGVSEQCSYSPDGKWLLVVQPVSGRIEVLDVAARRSIVIIKPADTPRGIGFAPDGKALYLVTDNSRRIEVVDTATWKIVTSIPAGGITGVIRQAHIRK